MKMKNKKVAIYARVSTDKQAVDMQLVELQEYLKKRQWGIYREYIDQGYTGGNTKRPAFGQMMEYACKRKFDILLVWKLDRLGRSLKDLIITLHELGALGIDFISYENQLDTSTPTGKLVFHVIGAVAEFEKDIIRERVKAGLENAKRTSKRLGRPPVSDGLLEKAKALRKEGLSFRKIGKRLGVDERTIRKKVKKAESKIKI
jgi:DNA invertase Pin-like site-specific DNA recombinase